MGIAVHDGYEVYPMSFFYGQRHQTELTSARAVAAHYGVPKERHLIVDLGRSIRGSALTGDADVPLDRPVEAIGTDVPITYVPSRNIIFLSHASAYAEAIGAEAIYIGVNSVDYSGYPDCRPEFVRAFQRVLDVGTKPGAEGHPVQVKAPLLYLSKGRIVKLAMQVGAPLHLSYSCYTGERPSCGKCDACLLRLRGFQEAGVEDPIPYRS